MFNIIHDKYLTLLSKVQSERGVLRRMRRYLRRGERDETKKVVEMKGYITSIREFKSKETQLHLSKGILVVNKEEMSQLFKDLEEVLIEDKNLLHDLIVLRKDITDELDKEMKRQNIKGNKAEAEKIKRYSALISEQINHMTKDFGNTLKTQLAQVAGRESLTVNKLKLIKDIQAQMQALEGDILKTRKDLRNWQKADKSAEKTAVKAVLNNFKEDMTKPIETDALFNEHSDHSLVGRLKATLDDLAGITQGIIIILEELHTQVIEYANIDGSKREVIKYTDLDPDHPMNRVVSLKMLHTPQIEGGFGYVDKNTKDLDREFADLLNWYKQQMNKILSLERIMLSDIERSAA